ncbi:MAG TPA: transcription antitermination factor NusB [Candidatus Hydrogenedentes bacterium]|nr:transcription antitermination factor NusB [Candidatus Hydrogenedentota bacterium]
MISPKARRHARECAVQFLFGLDFTQYDWERVLPGFWEVNPVRANVAQYANELVRGVMTCREELDGLIAKALHNWSPDRVGRVEQNILRVALYEMRHRDDVPAPVAINEAIEVVKRFGAPDSARFVNGVLDRLKDLPAATDSEAADPREDAAGSLHP